MATTPGNATNTNTTGIVGFTGTAMTGTAVTNHAVILGGATSSTLGSVGPGSTGQVLQANTSADPTYSTATYPSTATATGTLLRADGTNWVATTSTYPTTNAVNTLLYASSANVMNALATANSSYLTTNASGVPSWTTIPSNFVVGAARNTSSTKTSTSTALATTGTTPTTSNTTILISLTYTPISTNNIIRFNFSCPISNSSATQNGFFLFSDSTFITATLMPTTAGGNSTVNFSGYFTPLSTSSTTYAIYYAPAAGTTFTLQTTAGTALYGGTGATNIYFEILEVKS